MTPRHSPSSGGKRNTFGNDPTPTQPFCSPIISSLSSPRSQRSLTSSSNPCDEICLPRCRLSSGPAVESRVVPTPDPSVALTDGGKGAFRVARLSHRLGALVAIDPCSALQSPLARACLPYLCASGGAADAGVALSEAAVRNKRLMNDFGRGDRVWDARFGWYSLVGRSLEREEEGPAGEEGGYVDSRKGEGRRDLVVNALCAMLMDRRRAWELYERRSGSGTASPG